MHFLFFNNGGFRMGLLKIKSFFAKYYYEFCTFFVGIMFGVFDILGVTSSDLKETLFLPFYHCVLGSS